MPTYLFTWNTKRWDWTNLETDVDDLRRSGETEWRWSCGNNRSIPMGSRAFLLRQGATFPGIIGSGSVTKCPYEAAHWEEERRRAGDTAFFVKIEWDHFLPPRQVLNRSRLLRGILPHSLINIASGGVTIPPEAAFKLEKAWAGHTSSSISVAGVATPATAAMEGEPAEAVVYRRKRDIRLRNEAFAASRGICAACGTDFSTLLGGRGMRALQVHHKKQLGFRDKPRLTRSTDLAVVCANCHALIHFDPKKAMRVENLRAALSVRRH